MALIGPVDLNEVAEEEDEEDELFLSSFPAVVEPPDLENDCLEASLAEGYEEEEEEAVEVVDEVVDDPGGYECGGKG